MTTRWRIGDELDDGRCHAPSAKRNRDAILAVLERVLPRQGFVVEVGSGSGQHATFFAKALPGLTWQPSDIDAEMRRSIRAWIVEERAGNVRDPIALDVREHPWPVEEADAIVCINVLHVAPWAATQHLFAGADEVLSRSGVVYLYGAYRRGGCHTAPSNERFDAELRSFDPQWGLRDVDEVQEAASRAGFALSELVEMPANNLSLVFRRAQPAREKIT